MSGVRISHHPPSPDPLRPAFGTLDPASLPELWVLRHGETTWNRAGRWQGQRDSPLTPRGEAQARALGAMMARLGVGAGSHAILCSPQGRAARTAALAFGPQAACPEPALREIGVGAWTGRLVSEISAEAMLPAGADPWALYAAAPGGEGFAALEARCRGLLGRLDRPTVLVGHGITVRMIRALALGLPARALTELPGGQGVAFRLHAGREEAHWPGPEDGPVP